MPNPNRWRGSVLDDIVRERDPRQLRRHVWNALGASLGTRIGEIHTHRGRAAAAEAMRDIHSTHPDIEPLRGSAVNIYDRCHQFALARRGLPHAVCSVRMAELRQRNDELRAQLRAQLCTQQPQQPPQPPQRPQQPPQPQQPQPQQPQQPPPPPPRS
jgi:hypothetical protein